jgi:hypothetical protein
MAKIVKDNSKPLGKTFWDLLSEFFWGKPIAAIIVFIIIAMLLFAFVFSGLFSVNNGKISLGYTKSLDKVTSIAPSNDEIFKFCIEYGISLKKKYIIRSIVQTYDAILIGKNKDSLLIKERITYDIIAIQDITKNEDVFIEDYSSTVADNVKRWFGTNREVNIHMGNQQKFVVQIECKKGLSRTIMTGADFYYKLPLKNDRISQFRNIKLNNNEDLWVYPNSDDVVGQHTMIFSSEDLYLKPIADAAIHTKSTTNGKLIDDATPFYNYAEYGESKYVSVSYTWYKILPDEIFGLKIRW